MSDLSSYTHHTMTEADIRAVTEVLRSTQLTQGDNVARLEDMLAEYTGAEYAVVCSSGTSALYMAYRALMKEEPSIETVTVPAITFIATANAARIAGLDVTVADTTNGGQWREPDCKTDVFVPVHMAGTPTAFIDHEDVFIIEDAAHALGASYETGEKVGECPHSDMTCFSFHAAKLITTGEGGAVTTNDPDLYTRLCQLRDHGLIRINGQYMQSSPSLNFRMTDFAAALGCSQFSRLDDIVNRRKELTALYDELFMKINGVLPLNHAPGSAHHLYQVMFPNRHRRDYTRVFLKEKNIGTQVHYQPVTEIDTSYLGMYAPIEAQRYAARVLALPLHSGMSDEDVIWVTECIQQSQGAL